jgi:hypothetical protein
MTYIFTVSGDYQIPKDMEKDATLQSMGIRLHVISAHTVYGHSYKKHPYEVITILMKILGVTRLRIEAYSRYYPIKMDFDGPSAPWRVPSSAVLDDGSAEYAILSYTNKKMAISSRFRGFSQPLISA